MDKERVMKMNSKRNPRYTYTFKGNYILSYNERDNSVLLEKFDFPTHTVVTLYDGGITEDFWKIEDGSIKLEFLLENIEKHDLPFISVRAIKY